MKQLLNVGRMRLAVAAWLLLAACAVQAASSVHGKVVGVADGDTVTVLSAKNKRYKIRLQGVDAPELRQAAAGLDRVHFAGPVNDGQLGELYRRAALLLFPSRYEGYGSPVLEAMALGCPVVCSTAPSCMRATRG